MIDVNLRRHLAEKNSNKALMEGVKNALVEGFKAKGGEDTLKMVFEKHDDQEVKTLLEKIGSALPLIYNVIKKPIVLPKIFRVEGRVEVSKPVKVDNLNELKKYFESLEKTFNNIMLAIASMPQPQIKLPKIEIPAQVVNENPELKELLEKLNEKIDLIQGREIKFPKEINVGNFPPQMVPQPVTNININGLQGFAKATTTTVSTSPTQLPSYGQLFNRRSLIIFNNSSQTVYLGGSDVSTSNGLPVLTQSYSPAIDAGYNMVIYGIVASSTADVRVCEVSKDQTANVQE